MATAKWGEGEGGGGGDTHETDGGAVEAGEEGVDDRWQLGRERFDGKADAEHGARAGSGEEDEGEEGGQEAASEEGDGKGELTEGWAYGGEGPGRSAAR